MAKQDILNAIKEDKKNEKISKEVIADVFDAIFAELSKVDRTRVPGFGTFSSRTRAARTGFKPNTKEPIEIAAKKTLVFKIAADFKTELNPAPVVVVAPAAPKKATKKGTDTATAETKPTKAKAKTTVAEPVAAPAPVAPKAKAKATKTETKVEAAKVEAPKAETTKAKKK